MGSSNCNACWGTGTKTVSVANSKTEQHKRGVTKSEQNAGLQSNDVESWRSLALVFALGASLYIYLLSPMPLRNSFSITGDAKAVDAVIVAVIAMIVFVLVVGIVRVLIVALPYLIGLGLLGVIGSYFWG